jgi:hypothetical protein
MQLLSQWRKDRWTQEKTKPRDQRITRTQIGHIVHEAVIELKNKGRDDYKPETSDFKNAWYLMHHYRLRLPPANGIGPHVEIEWPPHLFGKQETAEEQTERQVLLLKSMCHRALKHLTFTQAQDGKNLRVVISDLLAENDRLTKLFDDLCEKYREECHQHKKPKLQRKEEEEEEGGFYLAVVAL